MFPVGAMNSNIEIIPFFSLFLFSHLLHFLSNFYAPGNVLDFDDSNDSIIQSLFQKKLFSIK